MIVARAIGFLALFLCMALSGPARALDRTQLGVIVNTRDAQSVAIANYYAARRRISFENMIQVSFTPESTLTRAQFEVIRAQVEEQALPHIQAYAITWTAPYRVECMSITSAFAFGFDPAFCADECKPTRPSPYFNSPARLPYTQLRIRPAMSIAATSLENAKALIDRGVESDGSRPSGAAYLLSTHGPRNVRSALYPLAEKAAGRRVRVRRLDQDALYDKEDVLFYFIGAAHVAGLDTLKFLPGAIADHLTSNGGAPVESGQMSALRWLEAGATGTYGAVAEPCNFPQKFPHPAIVMARYLRGETLIEAYWKSVLMPGQGIFYGEPLAAPFRRLDSRR